MIAIASQVTSHTCSNPHPVRKLGAIALLGTAYRDAIEFQSSPSRKTGRYSLRLTRSYLAKREFQSSPSPKTGRDVRIVYSGRQAARFQSSPSPKTGRYVEVAFTGNGATIVPILTQSENWALCLSSLLLMAKTQRSNPHPVRKLGAIALSNLPERKDQGSNPHPVRKLGAMRPYDDRVEERLQFQSSPSPKTGRYLKSLSF